MTGYLRRNPWFVQLWALHLGGCNMKELGPSSGQMQHGEVASVSLPIGSTSGSEDWWHLMVHQDGRVDMSCTYGFPTAKEGRTSAPDAMWSADEITLRDRCRLQSSVGPESLRCAFQIVETRVLENAVRSPNTIGAPNLSARRIIMDACQEATLDGSPFLPSTDESLDELCVPAEIEPSPNAGLSATTSGVVLEERLRFVGAGGDTYSLVADVSVDTQYLHGEARWIGVHPPVRAWNLGRLIALGCAYSQFEGAFTGMASDIVSNRISVVVEQLDAEFAIRRHLSFVEIGIHRGLTGHGALAAFNELESASRMSNWWHCAELASGE